MRGKTAKKLRKFVKILVENTTEEEKGQKSERKIYQEMKGLWRSEGKRGHTFVDWIIKTNQTPTN